MIASLSSFFPSLLIIMFPMWNSVVERLFSLRRNHDWLVVGLLKWMWRSLLITMGWKHHSVHRKQPAYFMFCNFRSCGWSKWCAKALKNVSSAKIVLMWWFMKSWKLVDNLFSFNKCSPLGHSRPQIAHYHQKQSTFSLLHTHTRQYNGVKFYTVLSLSSLSLSLLFLSLSLSQGQNRFWMHERAKEELKTALWNKRIPLDFIFPITAHT